MHAGGDRRLPDWVGSAVLALPVWGPAIAVGWVRTPGPWYLNVVALVPLVIPGLLLLGLLGPLVGWRRRTAFRVMFWDYRQIHVLGTYLVRASTAASIPPVENTPQVVNSAEQRTD